MTKIISEGNSLNPQPSSLNPQPDSPNPPC